MKKLFVILLALALSGIVACKTQAKLEKGEPMTCFQARFLAREGAETAATIMAEECPKELKREWCLRVLKERPEVFKDFNDCWRQ